VAARRGSHSVPQPAARRLKSLVTELEAALVPVNRRAAARSLSRLCREALKNPRNSAQAAASRPHVQDVRGSNLETEESARPQRHPAPAEPLVALHEASVLFDRVSPVIEKVRQSERVSPPVVSGEDADDDEPTLIRSSYSELPPAPDERFALPSQDSLLPPPSPEELELEFDVEFEEFELSRVDPRPLDHALSGDDSHSESSEPTPEQQRGSRSPSTAPGSSRYRSVQPPPSLSAPLIWDSSSPEAHPSDISLLLSALRRDALPSDQLYQALSSLAEGEVARADAGTAKAPDS
jgi:hypothetical protein